MTQETPEQVAERVYMAALGPIDREDMAQVCMVDMMADAVRADRERHAATMRDVAGKIERIRLARPAIVGITVSGMTVTAIGRPPPKR